MVKFNVELNYLNIPEYLTAKLLKLAIKLRPQYKNFILNRQFDNANKGEPKREGIKIPLQQFGIKEGIRKFDACRDLERRLNPDLKYSTMSMVRFPPNTKIAPHIDNQIRATVLSIPLVPKLNMYSFTKFYTEDSKNELEVFDWPAEAFFFATYYRHGVVNNNHERINFQIGFPYSIEHLYGLYKSRKIFILEDQNHAF